VTPRGGNEARRVTSPQYEGRCFVLNFLIFTFLFSYTFRTQVLDGAPQANNRR
jgi:hypothetical protein